MASRIEIVQTGKHLPEKVHTMRIGWVIALVSFVLSAAAARCEDARPNLVVIIADDHGQDLGCYGNRVIRTPNLDRLAAEGTRFENAFCTTASCSASRSVILTGRHNHANGQYGHAHDFHKFTTKPTEVSISKRLHDLGYRTARVGKFHVAPEDVYPFDEVIQANSRNAVQMANRSREFLTSNDERPFFLYFCTSDPHRGGGRATELPHGPDRFGNRPEGYPGVETVTFSPADVVVPPFLPDTPACRAELAQYYQSVSRIDQGVGRLMEILRTSNELANTVVMYLSDHGIAMPGAKTTLYEGGMKSPLIVRLPHAETRGIACDAMVSWVDLAPTWFEFAGGDPRAVSAFHGRSFQSVLETEKSTGWDQVFASHTFHEITMYYPMRVVRGRRYKLIWNVAHDLPFPFATDLWAAPTWQAQLAQGDDAPYGSWTVHSYQHRAEFELFDLTEDPWETRNLAGEPEQAARLAALQAELRAFQKRTQDPWIAKWQHE